MSDSRKRILCVDDDQDTRDLYSAVLCNYEVLTAATVEAALSLARKVTVDLYLLDAWLPDTSGIHLCRQIRRADSNTPILFVSGDANQSDQHEAILAGAQAYLVKPVSMLELLASVESLLRPAPIESIEGRALEVPAIQDEIAQPLADDESARRHHRQ